MHLIERARMAFFGGIGYPTQAFAHATAWVPIINSYNPVIGLTPARVAGAMASGIFGDARRQAGDDA